MKSDPNEALVPVGGRIDANEVCCRDLLAWRMFLLSTFRDDTAFTRRRARPRSHGRHWKQGDNFTARSCVGASVDEA